MLSKLPIVPVEDNCLLEVNVNSLNSPKKNQIYYKNIELKEKDLYHKLKKSWILQGSVHYYQFHFTFYFKYCRCIDESP
jgi:hypothetical protein